MSGKSKTNASKIKEAKAKFLGNVEQYPIITLACKKTGISRQTYYRYIEDDEQFYNNVQTALAKGKELINDMAESNIIQGVKDNDVRATMFWLNNNHQSYSNRKITANIVVHENKNIEKQITEILNSLSIKDEPKKKTTTIKKANKRVSKKQATKSRSSKK